MVIGCPYDGPAGLVSTNEKKALFLWSRRPGSEGDDSGSIKIEQNEAVHGQTVGASIYVM